MQDGADSTGSRPIAVVTAQEHGTPDAATMNRLLAIALSLTLLLAVGSCTSWEDEAAMPADDELAIVRPGLAVAPIVGTPMAASDRLTAQIAREAQGKGIRLAGDNPAGFDYVLEGTASARQTERGTVIAFAWDLTDAEGIRQHRFLDTQVVPTRSPEVAWGPAGEASLAAVADDVAEELAKFYGARMALAPVADETITTAAIPPAAREDRSPLAPVSLTGPVNVHLRQVAGEPKSASPVLGAALRAALQREGAHLVAAPEPGAVLVAGSVTSQPASGGSALVKVEWNVTNANGEEIGAIVQERLFTESELTDGWAEAAIQAADDAARGVFDLVSPERDSRKATATLKELRGFTPPEPY